MILAYYYLVEACWVF